MWYRMSRIDKDFDISFDFQHDRTRLSGWFWLSAWPHKTVRLIWTFSMTAQDCQFDLDFQHERTRLSGWFGLSAWTHKTVRLILTFSMTAQDCQADLDFQHDRTRLSVWFGLSAWTHKTVRLILTLQHDTTVMRLGLAMGIFNELQPPYLTTIIIELHQQDDNFFVKTLFDNHTSDSPYLKTIEGVYKLLLMGRMHLSLHTD